MANLNETTAWEDGIYQLEQTDPVLGGPDGIDNLQAKQLANRTAWLKQQFLAYLADLSNYAPLDSPLFVGNPRVPTAAQGTATTQAASTAFVRAEVSALVASAPGALDTLNELAAALGDDPNFAATVTAALAARATEVSTQTIWLPKGALKPRATNGPSSGSTALSGGIQLDTLNFDYATPEYAQFGIRMPKGWNEGTVSAQFEWTAAAAGDVIWAMRAVAISNDDPIDVTLASATMQQVTDSVTAVGDKMTSAFTPQVTIYGNPQEGDWIVFEFFRRADQAGDTLNANDASLIGVTLTYTTTSLNDA